MRWALVLVLVLCGCNRAFGLDSTYIAPPPDAPPCTMPAISDDFSQLSPVCGAWGQDTSGPNGTAWMSRQPGELVITPGPVMDYAQCMSGVFPLGPSGVFVEQREVVTGAGYGTFILETFTTLTDQKHNALSEFNVTSDFVGFADQDSCNAMGCTYYGKGPYVADQMRWTRIIPADNGTSIVAQVSANGIDWMDYGRRPLAAGATATYGRVYLGAGNNGTGSIGRQVFASFDICQD